MSHRLKLGPTIGEGGMAIVRSGTQTALHREVAVKTLRADTEDAARRLLREAWITGAGAPQHRTGPRLGADDRGRPLTADLAQRYVTPDELTIAAFLEHRTTSTQIAPGQDAVLVPIVPTPSAEPSSALTGSSSP